MQIILCLAAAMICGLLLTRVVKPVHLPNVTGYLIAGLIIGPYCLGIFQESDAAVTDVLTDVALGFIAFSIGGEFRISHIKQIGTSSITITFFQACLATLLVDAALLACGFPAPLSLTLGAIAAATAPAATLMVVRQYHAKGDVTSTLLPVVAMDDAVGLMLFSISLAISQALASNAALTVTSMLLQPLLEIVLSLAVGAGIGLLIALAMRFFHSKVNRISVAVAAVLLGSALASIWNLSSLLLCMAIGAILVNLRKDADELLEITDAWTPPLFMLFFVLSGGRAGSCSCSYCRALRRRLYGSSQFGKILRFFPRRNHCQVFAEYPQVSWLNASAASRCRDRHGASRLECPSGIRRSDPGGRVDGDADL